MFAIIASKRLDFKDHRNKTFSNGMTLAVMIIKEQLKKEFGIKTMAELDKKKLQEFEKFLETKL